MKNIFFAFVTVAILAMSPTDKDAVIRQLVKFINRFATDQAKIFDIRKDVAYLVYNMDKDTCMTAGMKQHILKIDSSLKNLTDRIGFTADELNNYYARHGLKN